MLVGAASQMPGASGGQGTEIDLDIDVSIELSKLTLSVGRLPDSQGSAVAGMPYSLV